MLYFRQCFGQLVSTNITPRLGGGKLSAVVSALCHGVRTTNMYLAHDNTGILDGAICRVGGRGGLRMGTVQLLHN